jgi:adenine phosphoribosyltransferase
MTVDRFAWLFASGSHEERIDKVVGIEARGYMFGPSLAYSLNAGFVPVRKPGKLPAKTVSESYSLEYGKDRLEMHADAIVPGDRVVIVDDVVATGGTAAATARLVEGQGGKVVSFAFIIELTFLPGRDKLAGYKMESLIRY